MTKADRDAAITVRQKTSDRVLVAAGFPVLGAGVGFLLKLLAGWASTWPWIPWQGPVDLIAKAPEPAATAGSLLLGAVVGGVVVFLAEQGYVTVTVEKDRITTDRGDSSQSAPRAAVSGVFADRKRLVVLGAQGEELVAEYRNEGADLPPVDRLAEAFGAHGYPWLPDGDPYRDTYRRWVADMPGLPPGGNVLLKARAEALKESEEKEIGELRRELAKLGVVVRDTDGRQWWRETGTPARP
ncbi:YqeB family protein [Kitasatospora griseola]